MARDEHKPDPGVWGRFTNFVSGLDRERVLVVAVFAVFVVNLIVGIALPFARYALVTQPAWQAEYESHECHAAPGNETPCPPRPIPQDMVWRSILTEYRLDAMATLMGLYLIFGPIAWVVEWQVFGLPWQPFVWLVAVASVPTLLRYGRGVNPWRLGIYVALIAFQLSGFAAYHWSTFGN